jgi:acyl-[acyl-carrier-protein]-phospholipid O-acyltransferase/long-chain-fatty-acid--[acyl-carrier-protein] ligase
MPGKYTDLLKEFGFSSFLIVQFLGALNDNLYKIVLSMLVIDNAGSGDSGRQLSLVGAVFILPFFLFSGYAGHLADVFNKRTVMIVTKGLEIPMMIAAYFAFLSGRVDVMLLILFLMAAESALFSPAKYGILTEMLPDRDLSRANGLLEMSTFLAIILGTSGGSALFAVWIGQWGAISLVVIGVSVLGSLFSLWIAKVPTPSFRKPFCLNPWGEIGIGIRHLYQDKTLWITVMGMAYFWFLGALYQMDILLFGKEVMGLDSFWIGILVTALACGIGLGSLAAGRLSGDKVELGMVPLGAAGIGLFSILLALSAAYFIVAAGALLFLGFSGGLFIVPLNAMLQQRSGPQEKGRLIASSNFISMIGVLLASATLFLFRDVLQISADRIILIFGFFTLAMIPIAMKILPDFITLFVRWIKRFSAGG